ncbi:MAG TPA: flavodoxin family protein [Lachnospiraceae bacterium]|nr:flavodoxin family protein [Lachnospiraceae bacterium]
MSINLMKTLIFNGSPRKNGDTFSLIKDLLEQIEGEFHIVNAYDCDIKPCIDCRYCWNKDGCSQKDGMQEVYQWIQDSDNIVIATPIYFSQPTGQLLAIMSRLQTYFCAKYIRKEIPVAKSKKGGVILVGGGEGNIESAYHTANVLLHDMNAMDIAPVIYSSNTDRIPSLKDEAVRTKIKDLADFFNESRQIEL